MKISTHTENGLVISRYENGQIQGLSEYVYSNNSSGKNAKATSHLVGAYLVFYKSGKLKTVAISGMPGSESSPTWSKTFNAKGEVIQTFGKQGKLQLPPKMLALLKRDGLLPQIQQVLSKPSATPRPRTVLSRTDR